MRRLFIVSLCLASLAACSTQVESNPARTAREQMLISTAADRAAQGLFLQMHPGSHVFVDASNFEGTDAKYAIGAIRTAMLQHGASLVDDKKKADAVVEIRAGALSTDQNTFLIGTPAFTVPIPLTSGALPFPELALYKDSDQTGVAKFAAAAYSAQDGNLIAVQEPQYGFSHNVEHTVLFLITWKSDDAFPDEDGQTFPPPPAAPSANPPPAAFFAAPPTAASSDANTAHHEPAAPRQSAPGY